MTNPSTEVATRDPDPLGTLSQFKGASWRTFVLPDVKVMFVQVNKNACTSLKWMVAGIAGEDLDAFGPSLQASTNRQDDIHDRRQWQKVPKLADLPESVRTEVHPDNGWFVFALTRDARSRLFSAWQSKLLLDNPGYVRYRDEPWYPRHPATIESVVADFSAFVEMFERHPGIGLRQDGHFRNQVEMLHLDLLDYTRIYDLREMGEMKADLRAHLDRVGWTGELVLPRLNDTPLRANGATFPGDLRERVEKLYAADFEKFGDRWDFAAIEKVPEWTPAELAEVDRIAEYGQRLGYLLTQAKQFRGELAEQRKRTRRQRERADDLQRRLAAAQRSAPKSAAESVRREVQRALAAVGRSANRTDRTTSR